MSAPATAVWGLVNEERDDLKWQVARFVHFLRTLQMSNLNGGNGPSSHMDGQILWRLLHLCG